MSLMKSTKCKIKINHFKIMTVEIKQLLKNIKYFNCLPACHVTVNQRQSSTWLNNTLSDNSNKIHVFIRS